MCVIKAPPGVCQQGSEIYCKLVVEESHQEKGSIQRLLRVLSAAAVVPTGRKSAVFVCGILFFENFPGNFSLPVKAERLWINPERIRRIQQSIKERADGDTHQKREKDNNFRLLTPTCHCRCNQVNNRRPVDALLRFTRIFRAHPLLQRLQPTATVARPNLHLNYRSKAANRVRWLSSPSQRRNPPRLQKMSLRLQT